MNIEDHHFCEEEGWVEGIHFAFYVAVVAVCSGSTLFSMHLKAGQFKGPIACSYSITTTQ